MGKELAEMYVDQPSSIMGDVSFSVFSSVVAALVL